MKIPTSVPSNRRPVYAATSPIFGTECVVGSSKTISPARMDGAIESVRTTRAFTYPVIDRSEKVIRTALKM